jgi:hypothetical protein
VLYFVAMRLLISADRPLDELHEAARKARIPKRMYVHGPVPHYRVSNRKFRDVCETFGFPGCMLGRQAIDAAIEACFRSELDEEGQRYQQRLEKLVVDMRRVTHLLQLLTTEPAGTA